MNLHFPPRMKILLLPAFLTLAALGSLTTSAQNPQTGRPMPIRQMMPTGIPDGELKRFDLDFPGGTPGEFAAAISKATGRHLNLIIPMEHAATKIMPIKVVGVTVKELFAAIQQASNREMIVVSSTGGNGTSRNIQYKSVSLSFSPASGSISDDAVWSFMSTEPTAEDAATLARLSDPQVCQYFQLARYLEDHTIADITTAIETGWKMLAVDPVPKLSFHEETKLLIAVGAAEYVQQIPAVLGQLGFDDSAAVDKIAKATAEIAALKAASEPGWENKAREIERRMERIADRQSAREKLQQLKTMPRPPQMPVPAR